MWGPGLFLSPMGWDAPPLARKARRGGQARSKAENDRYVSTIFRNAFLLQRIGKARGNSMGGNDVLSWDASFNAGIGFGAETCWKQQGQSHQRERGISRGAQCAAGGRD